MTAYIPSWGTKDPDDKRPKRYDAAGALARLGNPAVLAYNVFVAAKAFNAAGEEVDDDGALVISSVTYNPTTKCVDFIWSGGTKGWKYTVTCRLSLGPDWQIDQSGTVEIAEH